MATQAAHIDDIKSRISTLESRSAKDRFFDTIAGAAFEYANEMEREAEKWKKSYNDEKLKNDYLIALLKQNNIPVPDFSIDTTPSITRNNKKPTKCFRDLVQGDKESNLQKLHSRIDGHGGKDVAMILLRAKDATIISRLPNKAEFTSEFIEATGVWRSISTYLNPQKSVDYSSVTL